MNRISLFALITFAFLSCSTDPERFKNAMAFNDQKKIDGFPNHIVLNNPIKPPMNTVGLQAFRIIDSLLVLQKPKSNGMWDFYNLPNFKHKGDFLSKGEGPLEFMQTPNVVYKNTFLREDGNLVAYLYDCQKGRILKFNISESITKGQLHLSEYNRSLDPYAFSFVFINSDSVFMKEMGNADRQQIRYLLHDGKKQIPNFLYKLNDASIQEGEDFNLLSTMNKYSRENKIMVEMPIGLNNINLYTIDGSISKSLFLGNTVSNLDEIQKKNRWDRKYTYSDLRLFKNFFGVVYINETEKDYQTNRKNLSSILLFDWNGSALAKIETQKQFSSFDIDLVNNTLFTFDVQTDEFLQYQLKPSFQKLISK